MVELKNSSRVGFGEIGGRQEQWSLRLVVDAGLVEEELKKVELKIASCALVSVGRPNFR